MRKTRGTRLPTLSSVIPSCSHCLGLGDEVAGVLSLDFPRLFRYVRAAYPVHGDRPRPGLLLQTTARSGAWGRSPGCGAEAGTSTSPCAGSAPARHTHRRRRAASRRCVMTRRSLIIGCAIIWGLWLAPPAGAHQQCRPASPDEPVPLDVECHEHNPATGVGARISPATLHMNTWTQGTLIEQHEDPGWSPEQKYYYVLDIPSAGILKAELRGDVTRTEPFISKAEYDGEIPETTQAEYSVGIGPPGSESRPALAM